MERIDKLLSHEGFGSRKDIKRLLRTEDVFVNNTQIFDPGFLINPESDILKINEEQIDLHQNIYLMMNKIENTVCSNKDGEHKTVFDLLDEKYHTPYLQEHLHIVGRLDIDTEGLLLFTTDGALTHRLISPKSHVTKTYLCILEKNETEQSRKNIEAQFEKGIIIPPEDNDDEVQCLPASVTWPSEKEIQKHLVNSSYKGNIPDAALLTIFEGKYHQVKRMFRAVNTKVIFLKRITTGSLKLAPSLSPGEYRELTKDEILSLVK